MTMQPDGSLQMQQSQATFSQTYGDARRAENTGLFLFDQDEPQEVAALPPTSALIPSAVTPTPVILHAIDETAMRYGGHAALRAVGLSVTEWRDFFRANIEIESAYNPEARSHVGAIGLGQLMPATADDLGVDPHDLQENLDGSARYLLAMLSRFQDPLLALAAYNAGPEAIAQHEGIPPYRETQDHVVKVMGVFARLQGETG